MKKLLLALAAAALMASCASSVRLDEPPVSDATLKPVPSSDINAGAGGAAKSTVEPVRLDDANRDMAGPNGVGRVIYFDYDSFIIKSDFQPVIESHARFIKSAPGRKVVIEGNTDERGGREYNLALGQKRAEAVRRALGLLGVGDNQVEAVSFGKEKPADAGMSEEAFAKNRRAEIAYR